MAINTFSYAKKLKNGAVNQVVNDLIMAKGSMIMMEQKEKGWVDDSKIDGAIK